MIFHDIQQGTDEWLNLRKGKFTASTFKDLFAKETTAQYEKAIYRVVFERLSGERVDSEFKSAYMQRGNDLEPDALKRYSLKTFNSVTNGGFFEYDEWIGASPDGLIDEDGQVQVKCPAYNTMINYLLKKKLPNDYFYQVHGELFVTGRQWCDFYAYHPNLEGLIIRIDRDEAVIAEIHKKINESILKVKSIIKELTK
ncbi:lambda exonuclease family protein [Flavobacterium filum]|uniref:lambda exonuclease family protein n=1 Tax=Flavobacterium filum TaxID=370974 RepID=UPI0023F481D9|nr:lambda exonuclease family protein [Flavobacterium filum]